MEPTGLAKPGKTRGLTTTGTGLAPQAAMGRGFERFWNWTDPFLRSTPGPLSGYPDPLLPLPTNTISIHSWSLFSSYTAAALYLK